ncbi:MAG TPA: RNA polymerase sigma factor [Polyangiaceae bacterium]|nr:RNA polymerase sigma factor [Polyangiaceae bacterium]
MVLVSKTSERSGPRHAAPDAENDAPPASGTGTLNASRRRALPSDRTHDPLERARLLVTLAVRRVTSRSDHEFEDIVQTSLASALVALGERGFEGDTSAPWIVCVARNVAIDRLRARERERRVFERSDEVRQRVPSGRALEPDHLMHVRDELRRFDSSLRRLGAGQSMVVYLHDVLGHGLGEIALALDISVAAAQSRLIRGRRALKRELVPPRKPRTRRAGRPEAR